MGLGNEGAAFVAPPQATRATRGFAFVAALATLWISAAIGCVAVRRWRRALFWLLADWAWIVVYVVAAVTGHPRLMWAGLVGFIALRVPAAVDTYRIAARARARDEVTWPTLIKTWVVLTVGAIVVARGVIRPFFAEAFKLPSASMVPTLIIGDHIMVDKLHQLVGRGDVIVFKYPLEPNVDYVKRVVGLPGDRVEISHGRLIINGAALSRERYQEDCPKGPDGYTAFQDDIPCVLWHETLDSRTYDIGTNTVLGEARDVAPQVVPEGALFVLGDNRDNSSDSRAWGHVPLANLKGVARFIWWSSAGPDKRGGVRWDRIDTLIR
jgi:signal peptidase I